MQGAFLNQHTNTPMWDCGSGGTSRWSRSSSPPSKPYKDLILYLTRRPANLHPSLIWPTPIGLHTSGYSGQWGGGQRLSRSPPALTADTGSSLIDTLSPPPSGTSTGWQKLFARLMGLFTAMNIFSNQKSSDEYTYRG